MESDNLVEPPPKRAKSTNIKPQPCIFCDKDFNVKSPEVIPDTTKLEKLFLACIERDDHVGKLILDAKKCGELNKLRYHRNCRATYTSPLHIARAAKKIPVSIDNNGGSQKAQATLLTRSQNVDSKFDWKQNCFVCGETCHEKRRSEWSLVESAINNKSANIYMKMLEAAEMRDDQQMLARLHSLPNGDLVASDARYHRKKGCFPTYVNQRNISALKSEDQNDFAKNLIKYMTDMFYEQIVTEKQVFLISTLTTECQKHLKAQGVHNFAKYRTSYLKSLLNQHWDEVTFISQSGFSDLVVSTSITVGDAIRKAHVLEKHVMLQQEDEVQACEEKLLDEDSIVHKAVGILRKRISLIQSPQNEYFSSSEMTLQELKNFVDPLLYKTVGWLTNKQLFEDGADISDNEPDQKCLNIACDIITCSTSKYSPKHLGLSVHLHHMFGSRGLIENMYNMGYGISYTELRRFLTSAASFIRSMEPPFASGAFIPPEMSHIEDGGKQIVAVADNWDHNDHTVDGKRTTHGMTSILVSPVINEREENAIRIPRLTITSFQQNDIEGKYTYDLVKYLKIILIIFKYTIK